MLRPFLPDLDGRPLLVAHRGLPSAEAPDNTLGSYERALHEGADAVECDLRLADDGELILFHDRGLDSDREGRPVASLDAAARAAHRIPSLGALLDLMMSWPGRGIVLDIKTAAAADALFARHAPGPEAMVISFSDSVVRDAVAHAWPAAFFEGFLPMVLRDLTPDQAYFSPALGTVPNYPDLLTDDELARSLVGTVDDAPLALDLAARGVYGLTTKRVDILRAVLPTPGR